MSASSHDLPGVLGEIADLVGVGAALAIADQWGGQQVYIPLKPGADHWLTLCVGPEKAQTIATYFAVGSPEGRMTGVERLLIPRGPMALGRKARERLVREIESGSSVRTAARRAGLTERTAWYVKAKMKKGGRQGTLF